MPETTLKALAEHEEFWRALPAQADEVLAEFAKAGIDTDDVAPAAWRRGRLVRQVLERSAGLHRVQERSAQSCLSLDWREIENAPGRIFRHRTAPFGFSEPASHFEAGCYQDE